MNVILVRTVATVVGVGASIALNWVKQQELEQLIDDRITEKLTKN